jgi:hypothetical protein
VRQQCYAVEDFIGLDVPDAVLGFVQESRQRRAFRGIYFKPVHISPLSCFTFESSDSTAVGQLSNNG